MRRLLVATSLVALALGCAPAPDRGPVSSPNTTSSDVGVSVPGGETQEGTLVTLNVPGMT